MNELREGQKITMKYGQKREFLCCGRVSDVVLLENTDGHYFLLRSLRQLIEDGAELVDEPNP